MRGTIQFTCVSTAAAREFALWLGAQRSHGFDQTDNVVTVFSVSEHEAGVLEDKILSNAWALDSEVASARQAHAWRIRP